MNKNEYLVISLGILIVILLAAVFFTLRADAYYHSFRGHQVYFKNSPAIMIEDWMTPNTVLRNFNITEQQMFGILQINNSTNNLRTPIVDLCRDYRLNCPLLLDKLNSRVINNAY